MEYIVNPSMRLVTGQFRLAWHRIDDSVLQAEASRGRGAVYVNKKRCEVMAVETPGTLDMLYSPLSGFMARGQQQWMRRMVRDAVIHTAERILPGRLAALEQEHGLKSSGLSITKLRKNVLGQCDSGKHIYLTPMIVIFPTKIMDEIILHEMAHLRQMNHGAKFWALLSTLLGEDAKARDAKLNAFFGAYHPLFHYLMKP